MVRFDGALARQLILYDRFDYLRWIRLHVRQIFAVHGRTSIMDIMRAIACYRQLWQWRLMEKHPPRVTTRVIACYLHSWSFFTLRHSIAFHTSLHTSVVSAVIRHTTSVVSVVICTSHISAWSIRSDILSCVDSDSIVDIYPLWLQCFTRRISKIRWSCNNLILD